MAHHQRHNRMLKVILPDGYAQSIRTLTQKEVNQLPATVLDDLYALGDVVDAGDIVLLSIKNFEEHRSFVINSVQWAKHGQDAAFLQRGILEVARSDCDERRELYAAERHDQDTMLTTTRETHGHCRQRMDLYVFSAIHGLNDLKAYLSEQFVSFSYPMYEAGTLAMITRLSSANLMKDVHNTDPALSGFIGQCMQRFRDAIVTMRHALDTLRRCVSPKERLLAVASLLSDAILEKAAGALSASIDHRDETGALVDTFVAKSGHYPVSSGTDSESALTSIASSTSTRHAASAPSRATTPEPLASTDIRTHNTTPESPAIRVASNTAEPIGHWTDGRSSCDPLKRRRARPNLADFDYSSPPDTRKNHISLKRPSLANEYWSISGGDFKRLSRGKILERALIGLMCETQLGRSVARSCATCARRGHTCDAFVREKQTAYATRKCAYCLVRGVSCSLA